MVFVMWGKEGKGQWLTDNSETCSEWQAVPQAHPFCHICPTEQAGHRGPVIQTAISQTGAWALSADTHINSQTAQTRRGHPLPSLSFLPQEANIGFIAKISPFCDKIFTPLKTLHILFAVQYVIRTELHPKPQQPHLRHKTASCSSS